MPDSGDDGVMQTATRPPVALTLSAVRDATARSAAPRAVAASRTLGHQLERDRLEQRAARVRQVIHALRERADARDHAGGAPRPLRAAIEDFGRELAELERRLRQHSTSTSAPGGR